MSGGCGLERGCSRGLSGGAAGGGEGGGTRKTVSVTDTLAVTMGVDATAPLLPDALAMACRLRGLWMEAETAEAVEVSGPRPSMSSSTDRSSRRRRPLCTPSVTFAVGGAEAGRQASIAACSAARVVTFRLLTPANVSMEDTGRSSTVTTAPGSVIPSWAAAELALKVERFTAERVTRLELSVYGGDGLGGLGEGGSGGAGGGRVGLISGTGGGGAGGSVGRGGDGGMGCGGAVPGGMRV